MPAAYSKEHKRNATKHGVDAQVKSQSLIGMILVVLCPHLDPYSLIAISHDPNEGGWHTYMEMTFQI
jgi:hypothetical protein